MKKNRFTQTKGRIGKLAKTLSFLICLLISQHFKAQNVTVSGALTGNGSYPDLNSAFTAINGGAQTAAAIAINITGNTTETLPAVLNSGAWTSVSITPSGGALRTITGDIAGALIDLNGADNVYIDGLNNSGNALTITNTNTLNATTSTIRFMADATHNTVTRCTVLGSSTSATLGTISFSTTTSLGNSSVTISSCDVGPAGVNLPVNAFYAAGSTGFNNTNNTIQNCNIYDFYSNTLASIGILIGANNSDWTITGNRIYQTALRTYGTANTHKGIQVGSGNNYFITSNVVGYSSSISTGNYAMNSTVATRFIAIDISVGTLTASSVQGNTISAISLTTSSSASTVNGIICGINIGGGNVNVGTSTGNLIGGTTGVDLIAGNPTTAQGMVVGINSSSTGTIVIRNNYMGGLSSSGTTAALSGGVAGINISGIATLLTITSNTIGNASTDNMRAGTSALTTGASLASGINMTAVLAVSADVSGNLIRNFASYGTAAGGNMTGIRTAITGAAVFSINNNTITNLTTDNANITISSGQVGTAGILLNTGNTSTVSGNTIMNIANTSTSTTGVIVGGIVNSNGTNTVIRFNKIYNLINLCTSTVVTTPGVAAGIIIRSGTTNLTIYNNMISLGSGQTSNTSFMGIYGNHGSTPNPNNQIYYNTINIEGTAASGAQPSFGFMRGDFTTTLRVAPTDLRNNIITNTRSGGTGVHCALGNQYGSTSPNSTGWAANASNYNVLNANAATIGWWGTAQTFAGWKTASAGDGNSYSGITVTYSNSTNDLHLNMGITPTFIESGAQPIAGITTDYDNQVRPGPAGSINGGGLFPDIGADEIDAFIMDLAPPVMTGSGFTTPGCILTGRTFTAAFTDLAGVASGALAPRVYYKLNAGAYTSSSGTLTSGTANNGVWTFSMTYTGALTDIVSYFVVVQDAYGTPNLTAFPSAGFAGTDVNTITSNPTTPNTYGINALNGVYTVGSAGTFTSLTAAAAAYNTYCLLGPVTFSLTDALYSTAETFPIVFLNNPDASATNSLLIRPATGLGVAITPTSTSINSVFKFLNARYITIDGLNSGGSALTINNSNISSASADIWLASSGAGNNFIAVKNTTLNGGYNNGSNGVIASIDGAAPSGTGGADNDNITITGNAFSTFYQGILAVGTTTVSSGGLDNWIISNNLIGPATSGTSNIAGNGVYVNGALNLAINSNTIQNVSQAAAGGGIALVGNSNFTVNANVIRNFTTSVAGCSGININSNNNNFSVTQNTIMNLTTPAAASGLSSIAGMYIGTTVVTGTISGNTIMMAVCTHTNGYGARGIIVNSTATSALRIRNNMISDIKGSSDPTAPFWPIGIALEGTSGDVNVDFNSINIGGSYAGKNSAGCSAALYVNSTGGSLNIRNNIFSNTYDNTASTTDIAYSIYSAVALTNFSSINYNNYYVGGAASSLVLGYLGVNQTNIAGIQTAFGGNANSTNILPVFVSNTDLHMQPVAGNALLDNTGTPLAGITIDIDNQSRSLTAPDMGADEFSIPSCTNALGGTIAPTSTLVCSGSTLTATSTGVSTGLNTVYQWEVGATPGGPYINVTGGAGASTPSYTSAALTTGVYYVRLKTTCTTMTAASNEVTVTVNALPTAIAGVTSATICAGQSLNLNGSGTATSFTWTGPNSYSTTTQNAIVVSAAVAASGIYSLTGTGNGCTSTVGVVSVTVNAVPSAVTVTPNSATVCAGGSQTLATLGGTIPKIYAFGAQTNTNSAVTTSLAYPAPYNTFYGGQKMQMLILASELTTAGFSAGNALTNIQFPVVSLGSNWGTSITSNQSFQVNIGPTALTSLTTFQTGLTNVVAPANFVPAVGYGNTHTFSTPFIWNGTDNIILETTFSNNFLATANDAIVQYNSPTSYQSTLVYRADSQTPAVMAGQTASTFAYSVRPDFKLNGTEIGTFSWAPAATLSSATGSSVTATPLANTVYTVSSSNGACASPIGTATLSIAPAITVSIAATPTAVCAGDATTLTASGATSYTWDPTNMTNTISVSPAVGTTVYTVTAQSGNCAAVTETISIISHALPPVQASANPTLVCSGQSATLTGSGATTYSWVSGPATSTYAVNTAASYTVTGTDANGCSDDATLTVGSGTLPVVSASPATLAVCASSPASFTASGAATYSWSSGSTNTVLTVNAGANTVYTVTGFASTGCSATQTVGLTSLALPVLTVSPASPTICNTESVTLTASGATTFSWLPGTTTTTTLSVHPSATTSYSVDGMDANGCTGTKVVMVTVDPCTGVKESALSGKVNLYPNPSTGLITAEFGFDGVKNIVVFNSVGAVILNTNTQEQSATFDLSAFAKGVYFVNVKTNESSANYKIVIQ